MSLAKNILTMAQVAKKAALVLGQMTAEEKNVALEAMARAILERKDLILTQNRKDIKAAQKAKTAPALVDRLTLNEKRVWEMAEGLRSVAALRDPVGDVLQTLQRPNGLEIQKVRTAIGVIGIIYEARPNVTSDCIALCMKSGNAAILKGGKEALYSNKAIFSVLKAALKGTRVPPDAIQLIDSPDRKSVLHLLKLEQYVDMIIPRGGEGLIRFVAENSLIPVVKHYKGVCHTYVSGKADLEMARKICYNAKVQRPGVCNAMETLLVHKDVAGQFLPVMAAEYAKAGVELRGCPATRRILGKNVKAATKKDWETEYLDLILSVKVVDSLRDAVEHINTFGSHHSDAIVTKDRAEGEEFLRAVDSACLYVNASTRFTDGFQFGMGAEIGISTDKLHARGPMALKELTTYKYVARGNGQVRE